MTLSVGQVTLNDVVRNSEIGTDGFRRCLFIICDQFCSIKFLLFLTQAMSFWIHKYESKKISSYLAMWIHSQFEECPILCNTSLANFSTRNKYYDHILLFYV